MINSTTIGLGKFIKKFVLLITILIALDALIGHAFSYYYFKQKAGAFYRATYTIYTVKSDILIFGSSRASHHYIPAIFEQKFKETTYNCGRDGCNLIYNTAMISAILQRYTPKRIILDMRADELSYDEEGKLFQLRPYHNNPAINKYMKYDGPFEKYKLLSQMYPYNSMLTTLIFNDIAAGKEPVSDANGYVKLTTVMDPTVKTIYKYGKIKPERVKLFDDLLQVLNQKKIAVDIIISPIYNTIAEPDSNAYFIKKVCSKYSNVHFFNYENNLDFAANDYFKDEDHLDDKGANKFSNDLVNKILKE
jgi:hypothetical protein